MPITRGKKSNFKSLTSIFLTAISPIHRYEFLHDIELIFKNALQYNGEKSDYTVKAQRLLAVTQVSYIYKRNLGDEGIFLSWA